MPQLVLSDYVVAAEDSLVLDDYRGLQFGVSSAPIGSLTNYGSITVTNSNPSVSGGSTVALWGGVNFVRNYGSIYVESLNSLADGSSVTVASEFFNGGSIEVRGNTAYGIHYSSPSSVFKNDGDIKVYGVRAAQGVSVNSSSFQNDGNIIVDVTNPNDVYGFSSAVVIGRSIDFTNNGSIVLSDHNNSVQSAAIYYGHTDGVVQKIENGGLIQADWVLWDTASWSDYAVDEVANSGTFDGNVDLGYGDDLLVNTGWITGAAYLGFGNDRYEGAAAQSAVKVYGEEGGDTLLGGAFADRLEGGAGDDFLTGGDGADILVGGADTDILSGGLGADILTGGAGQDAFRDTAAGLNGDTITDLALGETIVITDADLASFSFSLTGSTLTYTGGSLTLQNKPPALKLVAGAASGGGVELHLSSKTTPESLGPDFNGDGRSDLFWRNDNGWISSWLGQAGGGFTGDAAVGGTVSSAWNVEGVGDFNGDGCSDLFWRDDNGWLASWLGQAGGGFVGDASLGGMVSSAWKVEGVGDFNGDGCSDLFWRDDNGWITAWLGQAGGGFAAASAVGGTVSLDWKPLAFGDFDGDGRSDILWRNENGQTAVWQGQANGEFTAGPTATPSVAAGWTLVGVADFDGNGRADPLWRNDAGALNGWLGQANGGFSYNYGVSQAVSPAWKIVGIGDYSGDGRADILWRNDNGFIASWIGLESGRYASDPAIGGSVSTDWWTV